MIIDPRLDAIDDCLYRVAVRALIVNDNKILLVQETPEMWWAFPGGGIAHGETIESALARELEEELGLPASALSPDYANMHCILGEVVNGVPRMNVFFRVTVREKALKATAHVAKWQWFTKNECMQLNLHPSFRKEELMKIIFDEQSEPGRQASFAPSGRPAFGGNS